MSVKNEIISTLISLGLSLSEAKVYLATIETGTATANTISHVSKISKPDIYRVMPRLQELGLIERIISTPFKFKPIAIQDAVCIMLETKTRETSELMTKARKLVEQCEKVSERAQAEVANSAFVLVPEKRAQINQKIIETIEATKTNIFCVIPIKRYFHAMWVFREDIMRALERGVEIKIITEKTEKKSELAHIQGIIKIFKNFPALKVRYANSKIGVSYWMRDNKELEIFVSPIYGQSSGGNLTPALWSNNISMLNLVREHFEMIWAGALEVNKE